MERNTINIAATVDALGVLAAEIAELTAKEKALKASLAEMGKGAYDGTSYRATVSIFDRAKYDMTAIKAKLSRQFLKAHTTYTPVVAVKVVARTRDVLGQPMMGGRVVLDEQASP